MVQEESNTMFWGVTLDGGLDYTQNVERAFHLSMAAIEPELDREKVKKNPFVSLMLKHNASEYLLCTLEHNRLLQQPLDLTFSPGEPIGFFLHGSGIVHLTGYLVDDVDEEDEDLDESDDESNDESLEADVEQVIMDHRNKSGTALSSKKKKKAKAAEEEDSDECANDEESGEEEADHNLGGGDNDVATKIDFNSDSSAEEEIVVTKKRKRTEDTPKKKSKKQLVETPPSTGKKAKKQPTPSGSEEPAKKRVLEGKVVVEDVKLGHGPQAKSGKVLTIHYTGRIASSGKLFESNVGAKPFKFRIGKKEVIQGWDVGINGMKVGGKRILTIPAQMAYKSQRMGPIPPNSALKFEVELKAVS